MSHIREREEDAREREMRVSEREAELAKLEEVRIPHPHAQPMTNTSHSEL